MSSAAGTSGSLPQISADQDLPSNPEGPKTFALQAEAVSGWERRQIIKAGAKSPKPIRMTPKQNNFPFQACYFTWWHIATC